VARNERVVVADIATHPYWRDYRDLALAHGLRACWSTPIPGSDGQPVGTFAVYYREAREPSAGELADIDRMLPMAAIAIESARLVARLRERDRFFDMALEIFCIFDPRIERIVQVNPTFLRITGHSAQTLTANHYLDFVHPEDRSATTSAVTVLTDGGRVTQFAYRFLCADGTYRWFEDLVECLPGDDGHSRLVGVMIDITERRELEEQLAYRAGHDRLTDLLTRQAFEDCLAREIAMPSAESAAVVFLDLDDFKLVNDSLGHRAGDEVLRVVAARLRSSVRASDPVARFGGDEFLLLISADSSEAVVELVRRLLGIVSAPSDVAGRRLNHPASAGIAFIAAGDTPESAIRNADLAMYVAKREGGADLRVFSAEMLDAAVGRLDRVADA
jgi:diguanylate cyclase (GGDEF)-like protein/PAS domain S-box-containing protein